MFNIGSIDLICQQCLNKVWFSPSVECQLQNNKKALYLFIYLSVPFLLSFISFSFFLSDTVIGHRWEVIVAFLTIFFADYLVKTVGQP